MYITRITSKGQATVPGVLRKKLGIQERDELIWFSEGHRMVVEPVRSFADPFEAFGQLKLKSSKSAAALSQEVEAEFW